MDQRLLHIVDITLDSYCFVISLVIFLSFFFSPSKGKLRSSKYFIATLVANIIVSVTDIFTLLCEGFAKPWYPIALPVSMFLYYAGNFSLMFMFVLFICYLLGKEIVGKPVRGLIWGLYAVSIALLCITPFTDFFYQIDAQNHYTRGEYIYVSFIIEGIMYIIFLSLIIKNRKKYGKKIITLFLSLVFIPQIMQIIQTAFYGISLVNTGWTLSTLILFISMNNSLEEEIVIKTKEVESQTERLIEIQDHTIVSLSNLVENRDSDTGQHVRRTSDYVELLAKQCMADGYYTEVLNPHYIELLKKAAPMHDIGKIVVSDVVLKKRGRLDENEFSQMKRHTLEGGRIILEVFADAEDWEYITTTMEIATGHHEKWNGAGYPKGLKGDAIPVSARIMAVADVFDALVSPRVYKKAMGYDEAFQIIQEGAGEHFDPVLVKEFIKLRNQVIEIDEKYKLMEEQITSIGELESEELEAI